jgi:hypothetical protein
MVKTPGLSLDPMSMTIGITGTWVLLTTTKLLQLGGYGDTSNECNNQEEKDCLPRASNSSTRMKGTFDFVHVLVADGLVLNCVVLSRMFGKLNCKVSLVF